MYVIYSFPVNIPSGYEEATDDEFNELFRKKEHSRRFEVDALNDVERMNKKYKGREFFYLPSNGR